MSTPTVIIVGAGHAGLEAAFAAARIGARVVVVTGSFATVGQTPCNPSVGGVAKGHLVHEIVALGGFMGRAADACAIHGRILNGSKGPAVRSTRVQVDKARYGAYARESLATARGVEVVEGLVESLIIEGGGTGGTPRVTGLRTADGATVRGDAVVVTTGTFLRGLLHVGHTQTPGGRAGEAPAAGLSRCLAELGFELKRLKTGTPPRLDRRSLDVDGLEVQPSDEPFPRFTPPDEPDQPRRLPTVHCWITYTQPETHALIRENLGRSAMYGGRIEGRGPRYCPSIEDKIVRFEHRERHQIFLEPETLPDQGDTLVYPNGISTSLPQDVQERFVRTIPGCERAVLVRPGYAVEYDAVDARQLDHRLASKSIDRLFFAGQINGTSGYEEAAAQGLLAGANAALTVLDRQPLEVARDRGYVGVLVDDLVTQGCDEPYRMFTSRAEYRLELREDNADERLHALAHEAGLIDDDAWSRVVARLEVVERLATSGSEDAPAWLVEKARSRAVYAGYLARQRREAARIRGEDAIDLAIPSDVDWRVVGGLSREMVDRLVTVRPATTGQASRIPGMTPAALSIVWAHARRTQRQARETARGSVPSGDASYES